MTIAVILDEREMRICRLGIELDFGLGILRREHGLFKGQFLGLMSLDPVIAVSADGHDGAVRVELLHALVEDGLEPTLASNASRRALIPMLVVAHEQHVVGNLRIGRVRPAVVVEGHGKNHRHAVRRESAGKLGRESPADPFARSAAILRSRRSAPETYWTGGRRRCLRCAPFVPRDWQAAAPIPRPSHFPSTAFWIIGRIGTFGLVS